MNRCNEFEWRDVEEEEFHAWPGPMYCGNCKHLLTPECPFNFRTGKIVDATAQLTDIEAQ